MNNNSVRITRDDLIRNKLLERFSTTLEIQINEEDKSFKFINIDQDSLKDILQKVKKMPNGLDVIYKNSTIKLVYENQKLTLIFP